MKTRIFLVAMALVIFASLSFGQGFCRQMYTMQQLTATCGGSDFLLDGTPVLIYWDSNSNGPDASDPLASAIPEPCVVNYSQFVINGESALGLPGAFVTDVDFCSAGCLPSPASFYLRVMCPNGSLNYVSNVATFTAGADVYEWTTFNCTSCEITQCTPDPLLNITAAGGTDPQNISVCAHLCAGFQTVVRICSSQPLNPANPPISSWHAGCSAPCNDTSIPAGEAVVSGPTYDNGCWVYILTGQTDNTGFCFTFERFLAVGFNNDLVATPMDNAVKLTWSTSSEANLVRYDIVRGGETVGHVDAANTGHTYEFVDHSAANGHTYSYKLVSVDANNNPTELATASSTPSFSAAVITEYALHQNFPNPFNPSTEIAFDVLNSNPVTLKVYNAAGQEVATLVNGARYEGGKRYVVNFDATNLTSGLYFYTVKVGNEFSATKKMLLVK